MFLQKVNLKMNFIKMLRPQRNNVLIGYSSGRNGTSFSRGFVLAKWNAFANEKMKQFK